MHRQVGEGRGGGGGGGLCLARLLSLAASWGRGDGDCPLTMISLRLSPTENIFLLEIKQGYRVCLLSWSVHCNFTGDGKCNQRGWACTPPTLPAWANFTLMMECTPCRKQPLLLCVVWGRGSPRKTGIDDAATKRC